MAVAVIDDDVPFWDLYELGVVTTVFGIPHRDLADPWYDMRLCAVGADRGEAASAHGFGLRTPYGPEGLLGADTVIVPSVPEACVEGGRELPPELIAALREAAAGGARMVSLCAGAFALAEAGVLDGRRATCHWMHTEELARRYPAVEVDDSVLYMDDGDVLTSAGVTAGLDLCLHLVRHDLGAHVANQLARRLVVPAHRPGGQAQYVDLSVPAAGDDGLAPVLQWATEHLDRPLTVDDLARRAGMSPRTFFRRLHAATGERIGERSGLGTGTNLRRHFAQHLGVSPTDYRRAFPNAA
ncbi:GlxA family transcriptional regulator [Streptomyces albireticuli]|uniref:GlxA family transcriptional regulator n=1 Tax=Streptomyces albireticuli TaxID=1940 RepID=UPI003B8A823C